MALLWEQGPLAPADLLALVAARRAWSQPTVKTLVARLIRKGALRSAKEAGRHLYTPLLTRDAWVRAEVDDLLRRAFDGRPEDLAAYLAARGSDPA
jgi:predicted transcriptional regulator